MAYRRRQGVAIVETEKGILVVAGRSKNFMLPGGGANKKETREKATLRELREETGLRAYASKYLFSHIWDAHKGHNGKYFRNHSKVFLVKAEGIAKPRHEVKYISYWSPNSNIRLSKNTKRIIDKYIKWKNRSFFKKIIDLFK